MSIVNSKIAPAMFHYFEEISKIPRGSGNEKGIADYLCAFADERGLACYRDAENNVLIKKKATEGREAEKPVLLQGHTDMVCEKLPEVEHDFLRDPIALCVEDGWLTAKGTTLGADDGAAVAAMLAILDGALVSHPAVECLFTTSEETGMNGTIAFDFSRVSARKMLNLDSASEAEVVCGCAGGVRSEITLCGDKAERSGDALCVSIEVGDVAKEEERYVCQVPVKKGGKWKRIILKSGDFKGEKTGKPLKSFSEGRALTFDSEKEGTKYAVTNILWL